MDSIDTLIDGDGDADVDTDGLYDKIEVRRRSAADRWPASV